MHTYSFKNIKAIYFLILFISYFLILFGCKSKEKQAPKKIFFNTAMLDSIKKSADSVYVKEYFTRDFAQAIYFENTKDTTLTQVMKDKDSVIRQVIITKNKNRIYFAQYYANGQLMAKYLLDKYGQYNGYCEEYYESGTIKTSGNYRSGFKIGQWKNFDEKDNQVSTSEYNNEGQEIKISNS